MERVSDRVSYTVLFAVGALCIITFLLVRLPRAPENCLLGLDGKAYFSYLRSFVFDGDLDFHNEGAYFGGARRETPSTGLPKNPFSVGPALLWAPFYLLGHLFSLMARAVGMQTDTNGYGLVYQSAICTATIVYVTAGCFLTYRVCRRYFSSFASLVAVTGLWMASSLFHYTLGACDMSHGVSFFAVSLFLFLWHPPGSRTYKEWILLGFATGLMTLVRWQNLLYIGILAVEAIQALKAGGPAGRRAAILHEYVKGGLVAGLVGTVVFAPQMLAWHTLYASPVTVPQGSGFFDWLHPNLLEYLFSTTPGLYTRHPIILLATIGLVPLWRRDRKVTVALLIPLLMQWYLNSAIAEGFANYEYAFGARRFTSAISVLALGMAALTESATGRLRAGSMVALAAVAALVGWNFLFELQFSLGFISYGKPLTWSELVIGKFEMILELIGRVIG